nr:hypothetical protein P1 [Bellflower vein chlorosis virus]
MNTLQSNAISNNGFTCSGGIFLTRNIICTHKRAFSSISSSSCNYCNFLFRLFTFYKKNKCMLNRSNIVKLCDLSFDELFNKSCFVFNLPKVSCGYIDNAARVINNKFSSQYDCSVSVHPGSNPEVTSHSDCWSVCNNAQHLFECVSFSDQTRGEWFPVLGKSNNWHTTCSGCGASCAFATPREGVILIIFLLNLKLRYNGERYFVALNCTEQWVHCSKEVALLVMHVGGSFIDMKGIEVKNVNPQSVAVYSNVFLGQCSMRQIFYGGNYVTRFAKDDDVLQTHGECAHSFYLTSCHGLQLKLTSEMTRYMLMLMPSCGYLTGLVSEPEAARDPKACGLLAVGGLAGVNLRCNSEFQELHEEFYKGPFREPEEELIVINAEAQAKRSSGYDPNDDEYNQTLQDQQEDDEEDMDDELQDHEEISTDWDAVLKDFLESDNNMMDVEDEVHSRVATRGLGMGLTKRLGGLVKGITNCVKKLHAVWDYPLDKALDIADQFGNWMDDNKKHTSEDVYMCASCPALEANYRVAFEEQKKVNDMLMASVKKLSETLDSYARQCKDNFVKIEERFNSPADRSNFELMNKKISMLADMVKEDVAKLQDEKAEDIRRLDSLIVELMNDIHASKSKMEEKPSKAKPTPSVGEQMPIPRMKIGRPSNPISLPQPIRKFGISATKQ